jgi:hypothetical protein
MVNAKASMGFKKVYRACTRFKTFTSGKDKTGIASNWIKKQSVPARNFYLF